MVWTNHHEVRSDGGRSSGYVWDQSTAIAACYSLVNMGGRSTRPIYATAIICRGSFGSDFPASGSTICVNFHATHLIAAGVDYRTVGDRMGHRSPSFTIATYAHAAARAQERAAAIANDLLMKSGASGG